MSRKSLKTVLSEVRTDILRKDYVRNALSSMKTHIYEMDAEALTREILIDLRYRYKINPNSSQIADITDSCEWYVETLAKAFQTNKFLKYTEGNRLKGGSLQTPVTPERLGKGKYRIVFEADGKKIFRRIKDIKRTYNRLLERKVARALELDKSIFDATGGDKSKGLVDLGHDVGYSIAETALSLTLGGNVEQLRRMGETDEAISLFLKKTGRALNPSFEIVVRDEGRYSNINTAGKGERGALTAVANAIEELLKNRDIDWPRAEGSPSFRQAARKALIDAASGKRVDNNNSTTEVSDKIKVKRQKTKSTLELPGMDIERPKQNWASILPVINSRLAAVVQSNMGEPALVNRTGTFAASARVTGVQPTAQGYPSFSMSYDKTPYGVFDRTTGALPWATPGRDPYTLIEKSIRQILSDYAIGRFYLRRT